MRVFCVPLRTGQQSGTLRRPKKPPQCPIPAKRPPNILDYVAAAAVAVVLTVVVLAAAAVVAVVVVKCVIPFTELCM